MLEPRQVRPLQQRLVNRDRACDLSLLPVQVAENHLNLERIGVRARGSRQLLDRLIDLMLGQEVQAEHVVRRLAQAPTVDPAPVAQLVPLPRLAHDEAHQKGHEGGEEREVVLDTPRSSQSATDRAGGPRRAPSARRQQRRPT